MMKFVISARVRLYGKMFTDSRHSVNRTMPSASFGCTHVCVCGICGVLLELFQKIAMSAKGWGKVDGGRWLRSLILGDPRNQKSRKEKKMEMSLGVGGEECSRIENYGILGGKEWRKKRETEKINKGIQISNKKDKGKKEKWHRRERKTTVQW